MSLKIKKNDKVQVISGKDKGKTGVIKTVYPAKNQVVVEGLNISTKHSKASQMSAGGLVKKEMPINASNVMLLDSNNKPSKVGYRFLEDGTKVRFFKTTNENI